MIDLVFVLTNKLDVSVKEIRKIVAENQEINERKIEEVQTSFADTSVKQDSEMKRLQMRLSEVEGKLENLSRRTEVSESRLEIVEQEGPKLSEKLSTFRKLQQSSDQIVEKLTKSQELQKNETKDLSSRMDQIKESFSQKLDDTSFNINARIETIESDMKHSVQETEEKILQTVAEDKIKLLEHIQKVQESQQDLVKCEQIKSSEVSELEQGIKENLRSIQSFDRKFDHFKELNEALVNNLKQSIKNTENQFLIHEKDQKNQIIFLENKINQKVYTHETHKKAEMRFQELELTSNHLKNDLEILTVKFTDFKES